MSQHSAGRLAAHWKDVLDRFEPTNSCVRAITTDNASSYYPLTHEPPSTLGASGPEWPALSNHIPCTAHIIQLAFGAFMSTLGGKGCTKSWEAQECNQQFGENQGIAIGKSQRLQNEGNATIHEVSTLRPVLAKIIKKGSISSNFGGTENDFYIAGNACCIDYADTGLSKPVH